MSLARKRNPVLESPGPYGSAYAKKILRRFTHHIVLPNECWPTWTKTCTIIYDNNNNNNYNNNDKNNNNNNNNNNNDKNNNNYNYNNFFF